MVGSDPGFQSPEPLERADGIQELLVERIKGTDMAENERTGSSKRKSSPVKNNLHKKSTKFSDSSIWSATQPALKFPSLSETARTDVCIVGTGIAGLTTGYLLALEGKSVIVIDKVSVGQGETAHTSTHLPMKSMRPIARLPGCTGKRGADGRGKPHRGNFEN
jgi:hypothetical protein